MLYEFYIVTNRLKDFDRTFIVHISICSFDQRTSANLLVSLYGSIVKSALLLKAAL